ncbi:Putative mitochondrial outer membrane transport complex Sam37/metaxin domain-containing protein [Septoria linicola]|uniref:Mitochondrial outer membrane transport complex Sam37/metaxin domain-containing protein n=1 Tax=Septoria linicola TaxID=215465 RepID=A0A9Q9AGA4_9PEZI|nr:putative mitochondrial outer membrane transport complex Sam37/metaxin domain-containing protein [Septoria linicola]USW48545.1 Putative mitochondrial outer membrane transport complex Sam37/metaxin domain-containing protein [Septoria linicola]
MKLFILGPAFGLASIDAQCIAAVALLQLYVPTDYEIIPTHDESRPLPHLVDGTAKVSGFNSIVRHLTDKRIIKDQLDRQQRADAVAIASFIENSAQTLLDISLYVGFENYRLATRPAYSKILPWHANYTLPPQKRNAARNRTDHLGISSIDVDNVHEDMSNRPEGFDGVGKEQKFEAATQKRASLLLGGKETLRSLLQKPEHAAVFKLNALADNFFEPLQDMLGDKQFLLDTEEPSAVDCLVAGSLSLMLFPRLPQDWLASTMRRKYKRLAAYIERLHKSLALSANVEHVLALGKCDTSANVQELRRRHRMSLPWSASPRSTIPETLHSLRIGLWSQIPILGQPHKLDLRNSKWHPFFYRNLQTLVLTATTSFGIVSFLSVYTGVVQWPHGEAVQVFGRRRISDFGHLGAALAGVSLFGPNGDSE